MHLAAPIRIKIPFSEIKHHAIFILLRHHNPCHSKYYHPLFWKKQTTILILCLTGRRRCPQIVSPMSRRHLLAWSECLERWSLFPSVEFYFWQTLLVVWSYSLPIECKGNKYIIFIHSKNYMFCRRNHFILNVCQKSLFLFILKLLTRGFFYSFLIYNFFFKIEYWLIWPNIVFIYIVWYTCSLMFVRT